MASSSCQQCARMLKHVLSQEKSRPMTILDAMGGKAGDENETGVEMKLPHATATPSRQWNQLQGPSSGPAPQLRADDAHPLSATTMATSAHAVHERSSDVVAAPSILESIKIECRPCSNTGPESGARAFVMGPSPLSIVLCSNRLSYHDSTEMEQVLVHELVHVYDVRVHQLDLRTCENLAYSEVRAARDAECKDAWLAGRYCVPHKAYLATSNLFPAEQAKACLSRVFDEAMADTVPLQPRPSCLGRPSSSSSKPNSWHFSGAGRPSER